MGKITEKICYKKNQTVGDIFLVFLIIKHLRDIKRKETIRA